MSNQLNPIPAIPFTAGDEQKLKEIMGTYCKKRNLFTVSSQTVGKPFRAVYINSPEAELLLMNPVIQKYGEDMVSSQEVSEWDTLRKGRVVPRSTSIEVMTDNLGLVVFAGNIEDKQSDLNECIMTQQMIDLLDGVTIKDKNINRPIITKKYERNQLVMVKSPEGLIDQMKYKVAEPLLAKGYTIL